MDYPDSDDPLNRNVHRPNFSICITAFRFSGIGLKRFRFTLCGCVVNSIETYIKSQLFIRFMYGSLRTLGEKENSGIRLGFLFNAKLPKELHADGQ